MISVVIPALNEESAIGKTVADVSKVLAAANLTPSEIVVVDDGSTDETGKIAAEAGARVIRHPHNVGYGRSLKHGIEASQYDMIAICDADGTYPISAIPELVRLYGEGHDLVDQLKSALALITASASVFMLKDVEATDDERYEAGLKLALELVSGESAPQSTAG